jgi:hypothetical protein
MYAPRPQFRALTDILDNLTARDELSFPDMPPTILFAAYDSRLTLGQALLCGMTQWVTPSAFAQTYYTMRTSQISDPQHKTARPHDSPAICDQVYDELLPHADPPFSILVRAASLLKGFQLLTPTTVSPDTSIPHSCLRSAMQGAQSNLSPSHFQPFHQM